MDTGATNSYVVKELLEQIQNTNYSILKTVSRKLMVANEETVDIVRKVVISIIIGGKAKHSMFRLVPKLKYACILGTDMFKVLRMILHYDSETWWLSGSPPTCYPMEAHPNLIPHLITDNKT